MIENKKFKIDVLKFGVKKYSRFHVILEIIKPEKPDPATTITGSEHIDVPGLSKKDYKVNFFAHKEGIWSTKVNDLFLTYHGFTTYCYISFIN